MTPLKTVLALDVGSKRVGVAIANLTVRLAKPLTTLDATAPSLIDTLENLIHEYSVAQIVVGWPRGLSGDSTPQTKTVEQFVQFLKTHIDIPIDMQDEALTSKRAEEELSGKGKSYQPGDIDALAATYILDDWLVEHQKVLRT